MKDVKDMKDVKGFVGKPLIVFMFFMTFMSFMVGFAQQQPTFKSGIEIFHLDVSVLDRNRQPVRGLTAADFTILEDGKPQEVVAFSAVDVPGAMAPPAKWMNEVTPDVTSNRFREQRLVLIVMDDATLPYDLRAMRNAKEIGHDVVNGLGPSDLAAVVFTRDNRRPQDFTADRARLHAAVERTTPSNLRSFQFDSMSATYYFSSVETLWEAARLLVDIPERRKVLIFISGGVPVDPEEVVAPGSAGEIQRRIIDRLSATFAQTARANVNVYAFDVCGIRAPGAGPRPMPCDLATVGPDLNVGYLQTLAANTGGRAVVNSNAPREKVASIFVENASYYLLGYESPEMKGSERYRRLEVKVNRPDVEVRARTRHYAEPAGALAPGSLMTPVTKALAGLLPKSDVALSAQAAPIAIPGQRDLTAVAITTTYRQPRDPAAAAGAAEIDWEVRAFDPEGRPRGVHQQRARLALRAGSSDVQVEFLARMDLKPGPYQLRLAAHDAALNKGGSVYVDVDVPDFGKAPVSLSGILLSASSAPVAAPRDALTALVPVVPTATRTFRAADRLGAFVRVCQSGDVKKPASPVTLVLRITGIDETPVVNQKQVLEPARFVNRTSDVNFEVRTPSLKPGPYVLTIEATLGKTMARRDVRFEIR